ncbi:phosphatidate cytidylyltransferase [Roseibacterium sp. SDUM158016]|uniref:phosphatidate cytidylyltransferase n=1 Tax=Roseicyclus sediminis TaxID=2980997 RepID=UPI0021D32DA2|nr:phosphatidate cytidylyltransferase [Roseibacterium sp. SDUM158016]MCU4654559.1 phosphatidate cytidylyltransferase [Roseibacterium sp. SDUM158016]
MPLGPGSFPDLATRILTGTAVAVVGLTAVWAGYPWFTLLVAAIVGGLVWELSRMLGAEPRIGLGLAGLGGAMLLVAKLLPTGLGLPLLFVTGLAGLSLLSRNRTLFLVITTLITLAAFGLVTHRDAFGVTWMLWLVLVVAVTDIGGYFAGRIFGGPKFWPRVSPKKTWSGTVAGWIAAGLVGWAFMAVTGMGVALIGISVALSMASQMGDIAESAVKRRAGVKDSSGLLPGHGGLWDRFDGMLGASLLLLVVEGLTEFPVVAG